MTLTLIISCVYKRPTDHLSKTDKSNLISPGDSSYIDTIKCLHDQNIDLKASLVRTYDSIVRNDAKYKAFDIKLSIINKSDNNCQLFPL